MTKRIAIFGGSFNPPCLHHRAIAERLAGIFDLVAVVPCGPRPDKPNVNAIDPRHRAAMVRLAFAGPPKVRADLFDLENGTFTRNHALEEIYRREGEPWHVVGTDLIEGGGRGASYIHRVWERGPELWRTLNFAVCRRPGYPLDENDLPPRHLVFDGSEGSSTEVRRRASLGLALDGLVEPAVAAYIDEHGLYRGTAS